MQWLEHSNLAGCHAFLSASKHSWVRYDEQKLIDTYNNFKAVQEGTELHELAATLITKRIKLKGRETLGLYVNDAIGYKMRAEQVLFYSPFCFGTADAISFRNNFLRIHDLKTGVSKVSMEQLEIYAALFCLEYKKDPHDLKMELRIYQNDDVRIEEPNPDDISFIMERIVEFDKVLQLQTQDKEN